MADRYPHFRPLSAVTAGRSRSEVVSRSEAIVSLALCFRRSRGRRPPGFPRMPPALWRAHARGRLGRLQLCEQLHHAVDDRLGPRRTPGNVNVHGNHVADVAHDVVAAVEGAAGDAARAHRYHELRHGHLLVGAQEPFPGEPRHRARADQHVSVPRRALELHAEPLQVVAGRKGGKDLDVAPVAGAAVEVHQPGELIRDHSAALSSTFRHGLIASCPALLSFSPAPAPRGRRSVPGYRRR